MGKRGIASECKPHRPQGAGNWPEAGALQGRPHPPLFDWVSKGDHLEIMRLTGRGWDELLRASEDDLAAIFAPKGGCIFPMRLRGSYKGCRTLADHARVVLQ